MMPPQMRLVITALAFVILALAPGSPAADRAPGTPVALRDLVPPDDPLRAHDLQFDARFAEAVSRSTPDAGRTLAYLAELPATSHLLAHARQFDYDVPKDSAASLARHLLSRSAGHEAAIGRSLRFFMGDLLGDPHWVDDTLRYLPADFRFHGHLFLVAGYDIGVALAPDASLNAAHAHFDGHPRELLYYAIHELHHVGFMTYSPPPRISDLKTCADVVKLVEYSTALEGTAVLAAFDRRSREHALDADQDYVALGDDARMARDEALYFEDLEYLKRRGAEPADSSALAVAERMSGGERLWYRVGARMARRIEHVNGRQALVALITREPTRLADTYLRTRAKGRGIGGSR
jgi:hypothetical protein